MDYSALFVEAIQKIDAINREDPTREESNGLQIPKALLYGQRMSTRLAQLYPDASEPLALAARAQHIRRWMIPRDSYPKGRQGYLRWRTALGEYHANITGALLQEVGYDEETIASVEALLRKEQLKTNPDTQRLEDVACLVFLEFYLEPFVKKHRDDEEKLTRIIRKTWKKMSPHGQQAAAKLRLPKDLYELITRATQ